jgi:hypothetical protein
LARSLRDIGGTVTGLAGTGLSCPTAPPRDNNTANKWQAATTLPTAVWCDFEEDLLCNKLVFPILGMSADEFALVADRAAAAALTEWRGLCAA